MLGKVSSILKGLALIIAISAFSEPPEKLQGFWAYCGDIKCESETDELESVILLFDDSAFHLCESVFDSQTPEIILSRNYSVKEGHFYEFKDEDTIVSKLDFINDSTIMFTSDSSKSFYRKIIN